MALHVARLLGQGHMAAHMHHVGAQALGVAAAMGAAAGAAVARRAASKAVREGLQLVSGGSSSSSRSCSRCRDRRGIGSSSGRSRQHHSSSSRRHSGNRQCDSSSSIRSRSHRSDGQTAMTAHVMCPQSTPYHHHQALASMSGQQPAANPAARKVRIATKASSPISSGRELLLCNRALLCSRVPMLCGKQRCQTR